MPARSVKWKAITIRTNSPIATPPKLPSKLSLNYTVECNFALKTLHASVGCGLLNAIAATIFKTASVSTGLLKNP